MVELCRFKTFLSLLKVMKKAHYEIHPIIT
jgi:hypothetical protein